MLNFELLMWNVECGMWNVEGCAQHSTFHIQNSLSFPLDNTEMLIINSISEICCWQGTFLGYDYRKLVEVNPLKVSFISEISNETICK